MSCLVCLTLVIIPVLIFFWCKKCPKAKECCFSYKAYYPILKKLFAKAALEKIKDERRIEAEKTPEREQEDPQLLKSPEDADSHTIYGLDLKGNSIIIKMILKHTLHAEIFIEFRVNNGKVYKFPNEEGTILCSLQSRQFKANGLCVQVLEPFRRLRITYNGLLKDINSTSTDGSEIEHVQFNFIWNSASAPIRYPQDMDPNMLAETITKQEWTADWLRHATTERGYDQYGALTGFIKGSAYPEELTFLLPSWRRRRYGCSEASSTRRELFFFGVTRHGSLFNCGFRLFKSSQFTAPIKYGSLLHINGELYPVTKFGMPLDKLKMDNMPNSYGLCFTANNKDLLGTITMKREDYIESISDQIIGWKTGIVTGSGNFDESDVQVILTHWKSGQGSTAVLPKPLLMEQPTKNKDNVLVCRLKSKECLDLSITGGKGNSLALLSNIKSDIFTVPDGFVVTVSAFKRQLATKPHLLEAIEELENVCFGKTQGNVEEMCKTTVELFNKAPVCEELAKIINAEITKVNAELNEEEREWRWAVRSSGVGEDSDELSAAGQNSTYLGCRDEDVLRAVSSCWGSLYTFQSVSYRKQHGIPVRCEMGVVVQKTVPAECAGVHFTCHPATGNPSEMVITSNYGLGESVVSATADPDTITIKRTYNGEVSMGEYTIGAKSTQITLGGTEEGAIEGTHELKISDSDAKKLSINEDQSLRLGKLAVLLEEEFGNPRDIEWAFYKNKLFLLQSRPITTLTTWTDYELLHEFDTPVLSEDNLYSRVNVGEVMKGAITCLTNTTLLRTMEQNIQRTMFNKPANPYVQRGTPIMMHYGFLDVLNVLYANVGKEISSSSRVMELAMIGYALMDEKIHKEALRRHGASKGLKRAMYMAKMIGKALLKVKGLKEATDINKNWDITIRPNDSVETIYKNIMSQLHVIDELLTCYTNLSFKNMFYQMITINKLTGGKSEFTPDHYHDIALVLKTAGGVESAELPVILEKIASVIRKSGKSKEFIETKPEEGRKWMKVQCPEAGIIFEMFLESHGHRLFSEYEFCQNTWAEDPAPIVAMIQANCRVETTTKKTETLDVQQTVAKLLTPKTESSRRVLRFLVKRVRDSLIGREQTKSQNIRGLGKFRTAFKKLGDRLVAEGYLPQHDLLYHLTASELYDVIKKRDPALLSKAMRRKRLHPQWSKMQFSDLCKGYPVPDRDGTEDFVLVRNTDDVVKLTGTPVCPGTIVARACVIVDLAECVQIQSGDILVTYSTDVGWTPYFPMLSGVVTEIGGLISHGAVVAREYGLPCIVGVQGATKAFKTGDKILLNGKNGSLELVQEG